MDLPSSSWWTGPHCPDESPSDARHYPLSHMVQADQVPQVLLREYCLLRCHWSYQIDHKGVVLWVHYSGLRQLRSQKWYLMYIYRCNVIIHEIVYISESMNIELNKMNTKNKVECDAENMIVLNLTNIYPAARRPLPSIRHHYNHTLPHL